MKTGGIAVLKHRELTDRIIKSFYKVYNTLGFGFLENVYRNALEIELRKCGLSVARQVRFEVRYDGQVVGTYFADLVVEGLVILELKAASSLVADNCSQLINYLKASKIEVGLLLNFGPRPELQRRVFDHSTGTGTVEDF